MTADSSSLDARWSAAALLAERIPADASTQRLRRILSVAAALTVLAAALMLVWNVLSDGEDSIWVEVVVYIVPLSLATIGLVWMAVWSARTGRLQEPSVLAPLSPSERKSARKQVAGKTSPDEQRLAVLLGHARQVRRQLLTQVPVLLLVTLIFVGTNLGSRTQLRWPQLLGAVGVILLAVGAVAGTIAYRRAGRFLQRWSAVLAMRQR